MQSNWREAVLGRTGRTVGRLGLSSGYGANERCVEIAFDRGVNYLYWGTFRRESFAEGLRKLAPKRDQFTLVIQSYTRMASLLAWSLESALRELRMDYTDVLLLGMWNKDVPRSIWDRALALKDRGLVKHLAVSTHNRPHVADIANTPQADIVHVRYNALHSGAEQDVFPHLSSPQTRPGIVSFTATSWGQLLKAAKVPAGNRVPTVSDCYRYVLSNPNVDVCLTGPKNEKELVEGLVALEQGPMSDEEIAWMRRVGDSKYGKPRARAHRSVA